MSPITETCCTHAWLTVTVCVQRGLNRIAIGRPYLLQYACSALMHRSQSTDMIVSSNVQIEPFHVHRHLLEENVCLSFSDTVFCLGSPGLRTASASEGPLRINVHLTCPPPGSPGNFTKHVGGKHTYNKKRRTESSEPLLFVGLGMCIYCKCVHS